MPLQPFDVRLVRAGEPVTAQAWNDIVNAIGDLHGFVEATTGSRLQVRVAGPSLDTDAVRIGLQEIAARRPRAALDSIEKTSLRLPGF